MIYDVQSQNPNIEISYTKAGLTIQGQPYRKLVKAPTPSEMINMSVSELDLILHIDTKRGPAIKKDGSVFYAYMAPAKTHQDARNIYKKLKLVQPNARHIPCAYSIPGSAPNANDCWDDGEPGSGRVILNIIENKGLTECAIFVVRIYGGIKMGGTRFACYEQAVYRMIESENSHPSPTASLQSIDLPNKRQSNDRKRVQHPTRPSYHKRGAHSSSRGGYRANWQQQAQGRPQYQQQNKYNSYQHSRPEHTRQTQLNAIRGACHHTKKHTSFRDGYNSNNPQARDPYMNFTFSLPEHRATPDETWSHNSSNEVK